MEFNTELQVPLPCRLEDLPTPCLLVDEDIVKKNCVEMINKCKKAG
jgi:D-serine deaminase-like pyridoxal phosphate-dependent protein